MRKFNLLKFFKKMGWKKLVFLFIPALLLIFWIIWGVIDSKKIKYETIEAQRMDVIQEVSVTGTVKPAEKVDLAFEKSGRVMGVYADIGEKIIKGELLARLNTAEQDASLIQARAAYDGELANLSELRKGTRPEEILIKETQMKSAQISYSEAKKSMVDKIVDAYVKADDSVRTKTDGVFYNARGANPEIIFSINDTNLQNKTESERAALELSLTAWKLKTDSINIANDLSDDVNLAKKTLSETKTFLDDLAMALNGASSNYWMTQATIDGWKTNVTTARTNISTAITALLTADEKMRGAEINLTLAENQLDLAKAGSTPEEIKIQESKVRQAEANIRSIEAQIVKNEIRAPIDGVISKKEIKVGEIVQPGTTAISLISESQFEIEANIAEADIAKLKIGQTAKVTLDAYGSKEEFDAVIVKIDPAETIIEGVATYKTTFQFAKADERIKSGMTANIDVLVESKNNVIAIAQRLLLDKEEGIFVKILENKVEKEVEVKTGLKSSDGNIEITSGINEGDILITSTKGGKK